MITIITEKIYKLELSKEEMQMKKPGMVTYAKFPPSSGMQCLLSINV